jgi:hypothetical protein
VSPIDINHFQPALGPGRILSIDLADVGEHLSLVTQLFFHYADRPLVLLIGDSPAGTAVGNRAAFDLGASISLWRRLQVGFVLPAVVYQHGDGINLPQISAGPNVSAGPNAAPLVVPAPASAGIGDVRLQVKGVMWRGDHGGVGAAADLSLPSGDANSFLGTPLPTLTLRLLAHASFRRVRAAIHLGGRFGAEEQALNLRTGNGLSYGAGVQVECVNHRDIQYFLLGEVYGLWFPQNGSRTEAPTEYHFALKVQGRGWNIFVGAGSGAPAGFGVPDYRIFVGGAWLVRWVRHALALP